MTNHEVLVPNGVVFCVVVDPANVWNLVTGFVSDRVVQNDDSVFRPPGFVALLERGQPLAVEAVLVPVVLI